MTVIIAEIGATLCAEAALAQSAAVVKVQELERRIVQIEEERLAQRPAKLEGVERTSAHAHGCIWGCRAIF